MLYDSVGNVQLMQKINRLKVLECLRLKGPMPRPEIARITGLSPSSITNIVTYLIEKKLVLEMGPIESREVGRKAILVRFNPNAADVVAINIEASNVTIALTNLEGDIKEVRKLDVSKLEKDFEILSKIKREVNTLVDSNSNIGGIGVAVSGLVVNDEKLVISSSLRWKGLSIKEYFEQSFKVPVFVQNNSKTKAVFVVSSMQETMEKNVVFLDLAMGIGIISIYDKKINEAIIGEFGHTTVKKDGPLCFCGNRGCLELMCSVDTVLNKCNEFLSEGKAEVLKSIVIKSKREPDFNMVCEAFNKGDRDVGLCLSECGEYLGVGLANIINIFNPDRIIINGDILLSCDHVYNTAVKEAEIRAYEQFTRDIKYQKVNIDIGSTIKGVALSVCNKLFEIDWMDI